MYCVSITRSQLAADTEITFARGGFICFNEARIGSPRRLPFSFSGTSIGFSSNHVFPA